MQGGNILGHIISNDGIRIDPIKVKETLKVELPRSKKEFQSLIRQVNFLRRFIPSFA